MNTGEKRRVSAMSRYMVAIPMVLMSIFTLHLFGAGKTLAAGDPPVVVDLFPADNYIDQLQPGDLTALNVQFDKNVELTGAGSITVLGSLGQTVLSYNLPHVDVQVFGDFLLVDNVVLPQGQMYSVQISSDALVAEGEPGVYFAGINDETTWNFNILGNDNNGVTGDDRVSDQDENAGPNGGDGNGDGTNDSSQAYVASFPNSQVGGGAYMTIEIDNQDCTSLKGIRVLSKSSLGINDDHDYPVGLLDFGVDCSGAGDSTEVTIYYDKVYDTSRWIARKYIDSAFQNLPGATFGTANIGGTQVTTMTYTLVDGGPLDTDGVANGRIQDPAGPGVVLAETTDGDTGLGTENELAETGTSVVLSMSLSIVIIFAAMGMTVVTRKKELN